MNNNLKKRNLKKKISLLISSLSGGGAETVSVSIANSFAERGWYVDLIVLNLRNETYLKRVSKKVNLVILKKNNARFAVLPLLKYLYEKKPNIFLVFNYELTIILVLLRKIFRFKIKIISRNINTFSIKINELNKNLWTNYVVVPLIKFFYQKIDYVINQCQGMQIDLIKVYPGLYNNSCIIYNPISKHIADYVNSNDLDKIKKQNYLLCVGRLEKQKGFHFAIEGFADLAKKIPNLRLKILGEGKMKQQLKEIAKTHGIDDRVDFEGFKKDTIPYYLYAKATVLTSLYEGFPNVLIESIALGTPVVSFDCPSGPSEIIKEGINGYLVEYKSVEDLKDKLFAVMSNQFSIKKMNSTVKKYDAKKIIERYENLLNVYI